MEQLTPKQNLAVDLVAISFDAARRRLCVFAPVRTVPYATGRRALPGTLLNVGESLDQAVERVFAQKFDQRPAQYLTKALAPKTDPERDPRGHVLSLPIVVFIPGREDLSVDWLDLGPDLDLAFDHAAIVADAMAWIGSSLMTVPLVLAALPNPCFLLDARDAYAQIDPVHQRSTTNFSRQSPILEFLIDSGQKLATGKRGGQPTIYRVDLEALEEKSR